jgi:hypothetical protein
MSSMSAGTTMHSTSKPADGSVSDEDFGGEFADFGSGFDPDAYGGAGGAEMKVLPNAGRLGSRQLANDGVQPDDAWEGDAESAMLLSGQAAKQQQVGLAQTQKARKSRERRWCVSMLLLVAAWLFAGIVVALSWSLSPAFPRTPANHDLPDVPLLKLTVADWVSGRASGVPGGGYAAPNTSLPAVLPVPGSTVDGYGQWKYAAGDAEMEAEAFDGVIEGSIAAGSWKLFKYRQLMLNATFAIEFHLRLPVLKDLLRTNTSRPPCAGAFPFSSPHSPRVPDVPRTELGVRMLASHVHVCWCACVCVCRWGQRAGVSDSAGACGTDAVTTRP